MENNILENMDSVLFAVILLYFSIITQNKIAMQALNLHGVCIQMVAPEGFEPPTFWFVAKRSIQLSYGVTSSLFSTAKLL